jgi:hypothetical protein
MMMHGLANPKLLDLYIYIIENPWDGSKKFSILSNLTVINTIRTSHGNKKTIVFALCRIEVWIYSISTCQLTQCLSVLSTTAMVR